MPFSLTDTIPELDIRQFDAIPPQASDDDKRMLLLAQQAIRGAKKSYTYLETGSYLGGSLQIHLVNPYCKHIYSIDKRPELQPDERHKAYAYPKDGTEQMIGLLQTHYPNVSLDKLEILNTSTEDLSADAISQPPDLCFIDSEHTVRQALVDFFFCLKVAQKDCLIVFHDANIVHRAILIAKIYAARRNLQFSAMKVAGNIYIFLMGVYAETLRSQFEPYAVDDVLFEQEARTFLTKVRQRHAGEGNQPVADTEEKLPVDTLIAQIAVLAKNGDAEGLSKTYFKLYAALLEEDRIDEALLCLEALMHTGEHAEHQQRFEDYPMLVRVETAALCNAKCGFCPYHTLPRKGMHISDELYEKLLQDLQEIPRDHRFQLHFNHINEPLLDKRLISFMERAQKLLPNAQLGLVSNGSLLDRPKIEKLLSLRQLEMINISLNHYDADAYAAEMGLRFEDTAANLDCLHDAYKADTALRITLRRVGNSQAEDANFVRYCNQRWPKFTARTTTCKDFVGQVTDSVRTFHNKLGNIDKTAIYPGCRQWFQMTVAATGEVALCCFDGKLQWKMGNIKEKQLLELYKIARKNRLKQCVTRIEAPTPCRECDILFV